MSDELVCTGCGKKHHQTRKLIAVAHRVFLCDECVNLCVEILHSGGLPAGMVAIAADELDKLRKDAHNGSLAKIWLVSMKQSMANADALLTSGDGSA